MLHVLMGKKTVQWIICLLAAMLILSSGAALAEGEELLKNGDFSGNLLFQLYTESGGSAAIRIDGGELLIDVASAGRVAHAVQPYYDGFGLTENVEYVLAYDVHASMERSVFIRIQLNGGDYHAYFEELVPVGPEIRHHEHVFTMAEPTDPAPRLCVNMGYTEDLADAGIQPADVPAHQVWFDNFSLKVKDASGAAVSEESEAAASVHLDQVGYFPNAVKTAVTAGLPEGADTFAVIRADSGETVLEGKLTPAVVNEAAGEENRTADFSALAEPGLYMLKIADGTVSPAFAVGEDVYLGLRKDLARMLYLQRCGTKLDAAEAGIYAHPVCHDEPALIYGTDQRLDVSGGWHDAGDYGRYVVSGAKAAADLLLAYEGAGSLTDDSGIPESGDGVDDLLQEACYELDWMLKMQASDGGVYHKVTCRSFPGFVMPEKETDELVICPVSNTATGDFAAVMALASRLFTAQEDPDLKARADVYLTAAVRAWEYLQTHTGEQGFRNPADVSTGEYPDDKDCDERFWAAAELLRATGEAEYGRAALQALAEDGAALGLGWLDVGQYGLYAVLSDERLDKADPLYVRAAECLTQAADRAMDTIESNPYRVNRTENYEWGSNMGIANDGVMLLMAARTLNADTRGAAQDQLHYLLGRNATGYCFVTGTGTKFPEHPHHRPSQAAGAAVPGMLVGGPNSALEDPYAANVLAKEAPAKCYADSDQSYSTNEVCVYWNSPLILLLSWLCAE